MIARLLNDFIKGSKLIVLSAKQRHDCHTGASIFLGGLFLFSVASITVYVSSIYSAVNATSK